MVTAKIFKRFGPGIILILALITIENVAWIAEPTIFGYVIDAFIEKENFKDLPFLMHLGLWVGVYLINTSAGAARRYFDQRVYLKIFAKIATDVAHTAGLLGEPLSKTVARAELSREYVTFVQYRLPELLEQTISIGGTIIALMYFDYRIAIACMFIFLPVLVMAKVYATRVLKLQEDLHDIREEQLDVYNSRDVTRIKEYYTRLTARETKISGWGAVNFGMLRVSLLVIFLVVLYISIDMNEFTTGNIYSIVAYLWTFVSSTEYLPDLMESTSSLRDINRRLKELNLQTFKG